MRRLLYLLGLLASQPCIAALENLVQLDSGLVQSANAGMIEHRNCE